MNISDSYPDPVPLQACIDRQWRVVGNPKNPITRLMLRYSVHQSARELKEEIDSSRARDRELFRSWGVDGHHNSAR